MSAHDKEINPYYSYFIANMKIKFHENSSNAAPTYNFHE